MDPPFQQCPPPISNLGSPTGDGQLFTIHTSSWQELGQDGFLSYWK